MSVEWKKWSTSTSFPFRSQQQSFWYFPPSLPAVASATHVKQISQKPSSPQWNHLLCSLCTSSNIWFCLAFPLLALPSMKILLEALSLKNKPASSVPPREAFTFANSIDLILEAAGSSPRSLINMTTPSEARTSRSLSQNLLLGSSLTLTESLTTTKKDLQ